MVLTYFQPQLHNRMSLLTFGALQLFGGFFAIWLDVAVFAIFRPHPAGLWPSILLMTTGCFGMRAGWLLPMGTAPWSRLPALITSLILSLLALVLSIMLQAVWMAVILNGHPSAEALMSTPVIALYLVQLFFGIVDLGQVISTSVNIHKLGSGFVAPAPHDTIEQDNGKKLEWMLTRSAAIYDVKK